MSRNPEYQKLLNSKRWKQLRIAYLREHPLCEECLSNDKISSAIDVHHVYPVERGKDLQEMTDLCYNQSAEHPNNLRALCIPCHCEVHRQMRSHTWQMIRKMPQDEQTDEDAKLKDWVQRVSGGKCEEIKPKPKKGVRKTKYGWMTLEEAKQKEREELEAWAKRYEQKTSDTTFTKD